MNSLLFLLFTVLFTTASSQVITVIDKVSREPIPGVVISDAEKELNVMTNKNGQADLGIFPENDSIFFSYLSYKTAGYPNKRSPGLNVELSPGELALKEIVISANRWEEQASETPNRIEKIGKKDIELRNAQTSADLLESSGYVFVQKSQLAGGSPILRGFATNRVMLIVDGVRMNNAIFRSGNVQNVISVDANAIENAEILFGPGAVMYGSDAIGGVMDFHTLSPKFGDTAGKTFVGDNVMGRLSSANREKTIHADVNAGGKRWSWLSSFSRSEYDDLKAGSIGNHYFLRPSYQVESNGRDSVVKNNDPQLQKPSGFDQTHFIQKVGLRLNELTEIDYGFYYSEASNAPRYDRLYADANSDSIFDYAEWYYGPQTWMMNRLGFRNSKNKLLYNKMKLTAAWQRFGESRHDRRFNSDVLRRQFENVDAYSLNIDLDKKAGPRFNLFYGVEAIYNQVGSQAHRVNKISGAISSAPSRYPDNSNWQAYGLYVNSRYDLRPNLILNAGFRYSYFVINAAFDTSAFKLPFTNANISKGALNGSAGISWLANKSSRMYMNASSGFRAPNIDDIGKVFESQPGLLVVPNNNLGPEYAYNFEAGAVKIFRSRVKADVALYYTMLHNAMARRPFEINRQDCVIYEGINSRVMAIQNISSAYVYGIQAGVEADIGKGFGFTGKISFQKGKEQGGDNLLYYPKPQVPPLFGRSDITYRRKSLRLDLYTIYNRQMRFNDLSLNDRQDDTPFAKDDRGLPFVPEWYTLNLKAAWYINRHFILSGGVENITDQLYRPFSSGISAAGRNFIVSLKFKT